MQRTIATTALLAGFIAAMALPAPAPAQTGTYYFPPKLIKQGKATLANGGAGTVVVKVAVNPDGTFKVQERHPLDEHGQQQGGARDCADVEIQTGGTRR